LHPCSSSPESPPFSFPSHAAHRDLPSFPTRRSSDLRRLPRSSARGQRRSLCGLAAKHDQRASGSSRLAAASKARSAAVYCGRLRSEEHTSELQSPYDLVCRLLLEKKK